MSATIAYAPQKSIEWLRMNPGISATLARFETGLKKISRQGYQLLVNHLANLIPDNSYVKTVETHPKVRAYMNQQGGISKAADKIAKFFNNVRAARERFVQAIKNSIGSVKEQGYLIAFFNLFILYCHSDKL